MDACVIDWQAVSGIGSLCVALLALIYTVRESKKTTTERLTERQALAQERRLMVRPFVTGTWELHEPMNLITFTLQNVGLGPARIVACRPVYRGQSMEELHLEQIVFDFGASEAMPGRYCPQVTPGTMLPVGGEMCLLELTFTKVSEDFELTKVRDAIKFDVECQNIYGDVVPSDGSL